MKLFRLFIITGLLLLNHSTFAQVFEIPKNVKLVDGSDYEQYQDDVLKGINWLENTSVDKQQAKREKTSAFLLEWIMGTPDFSIGLQAFQIKLTEKNPELLLSFLGGWTKFAIKNPTEKDDVIKANLAGFQSVMNVYLLNMSTNAGFKKDKKIEKIIKMNPEQLQKWVKKNVL